MNLTAATYIYLGLFLMTIPGHKEGELYSQNRYQTIPMQTENHYALGMEALAENNFEAAEDLFRSSIYNSNDAPSHFELAKIYLRKNTFYWRNKALDHFMKAVSRDQDNIEYRYAYAKLLEDFARFSAVDQYKKIIEMDHKQVEAWNSLARMKEAEFVEFNNSVRNMDGFMGSLQEFAMEDFAEAEHYLQKVIEIDSTNFNANFKLGKLYESAELYEKAVPYFEKCGVMKTDNKETNLYLGLLYYKTSKMEEAHRQYRKAFKLMDREERKEYTFESAKLLLEPAFEDIINKYEDWETEQFIESYWEINDPLYLSDFNERVLEHYSRVAYAKLHFSVEDLEINGWKSDKGEFVLRYGEPGKRMRIRPEKLAEGVAVKTEVWYYNDMTLAFTDFASSGNYKYSAPSPDKWQMKSQYGGDSQWLADNLKTIKHDDYVPHFEGPLFEAPFSIAQFRSNNDRNKTDVYINYGLDLTDSVFIAADINYDHKLGLFYFDRYHNEIYKRKANIKSASLPGRVVVSDNSELILNSARFTASPDSGMFAFELQRDGDKAVSANRFRLTTKKFTKDDFNMSDIMLATGVELASDENYLIRRGDYTIQPNPTHVFSNTLPLFIYYEIYNLTLGANRLTDFQQEIVITKIEETVSTGNIFNNILSFFGLAGDEQITFTTHYQTQETDPQLFLQIDMSSYEPGEYLLSLKITDELTGNAVQEFASFIWSN